MSLPKSGLAGPFLAFANAVQRAFETLASVRLTIINDTSELPSASQWQGRQIIVRDLNGLGKKGTVTALDGVWIDYTGATIA